MSRAITITVLTCFLVLGAATTAILGRDSVPSVSAEMITQVPPPKPLAANRAAKADRLVPTLALASAAIEPVQVPADRLSQAPVLTEPLRQAFAAATPPDFPMPKVQESKSAETKTGETKTGETKVASLEVSATAEEPTGALHETRAKPKVAAKPQKSYSLLSDVQIAGIRDRLKLSSSQEYYWPSVETALRNVVRKISANKLSNPNGPNVQIDPDCDEVQQLKSAAMPLLFQLRDDQKEEVRKLARIIGLEKVAQQI